MKYLVGFSRLFVGILFIISGFIKLNDPLGFSFKLQEYFSPAVLNLSFLEPYALSLALFVVIFEVLLGVFLLLGFKVKFTVWSLLLMIVFFTFLTFYSAYFNKVTDCGCFGDAVKLTPWESFTKDIILMIFILVLFFFKQHIKPLFAAGLRNVLSLLTLVLCVAYAYHVLNHLPVIDFRPYKINANIPEGMSIPEGAPEALFDYHWKFLVNGEEKIFTTQGAYPDVNGEYVSVKTEEVQTGYEPPIHDFTIEKNGEDKAEELLKEPHLIMIVSYDLNLSDQEAFKNLKVWTDDAQRKGYKVIGMSASNDSQTQALKQHYSLNFDFYFTDQTTLKTIVRSNPGILVVEKGTIVQKSHFNDLEDVNLKTLANANFKLDLDLKRQLDSIMVMDQKYRIQMTHDLPEDKMKELWTSQHAVDQSNLAFIENVIAKHGYPGKSLVGEGANKAAWFVIQHSDKIADYIDLLKESGSKGEFPFTLAAMMEDRHLMQQGKPQLYGTQAMSFEKNGETVRFIWPIENAEQVNELRIRVGFDLTVEAYAHDMGIEYQPLTMEEMEKLKQ
jgi:uncharacterized membrane protein YphA (DoxX/SURF4 family)